MERPPFWYYQKGIISILDYSVKGELPPKPFCCIPMSKKGGRNIPGDKTYRGMLYKGRESKGRKGLRNDAKALFGEMGVEGENRFYSKSPHYLKTDTVDKTEVSP